MGYLIKSLQLSNEDTEREWHFSRKTLGRILLGKSHITITIKSSLELLESSSESVKKTKNGIKMRETATGEIDELIKLLVFVSVHVMKLA
jgi:hypothetical protein